MKDKKANHKVAIITGASGGIGYQVATFLLTKNYLVYSLSRNRSQNNNIKYLICDITNFNEVKQCINQIYLEQQRIDLVINNSAFAITTSCEELKVSDYEKIMSVNVEAALNICSLSVDYLAKTKGKIINMGSIVSEIIIPFGVQYSLSKQLLKLLSFCLYQHCKSKNVGICYLILGKVKSDFDKNRIINANKNSCYLEYLNNTYKNIVKSSIHAISIQKIPPVIYKLAVKKKIPHQKIVGFNSKMLIFFFKLIPTKLAIKINFSFFANQNKLKQKNHKIIKI